MVAARRLRVRRTGATPSRRTVSAAGRQVSTTAQTPANLGCIRAFGSGCSMTGSARSASACAGVSLPATDVTTKAATPAVGTVMARVVASTADDGTTLSTGPTHCGRCPSLAVADRRVLCRHDALCPGLDIGRDGRSGCSAAGPRIQRRPVHRIALAGRVPATAGSRMSRLRVERHHVACENGRGRLSLGEGRLNQPQSHQLDRQLGTGCRGGGRAVREGDGSDVPGRLVACHRGRAHGSTACAFQPAIAQGRTRSWIASPSTGHAVSS